MCVFPSVYLRAKFHEMKAPFDLILFGGGFLLSLRVGSWENGAKII